MSDSNDQYNTPPAPEQFDPSPFPVEPAHTAVHHDLSPGSEERPSYAERLIRVDDNPGTLEPVPVVAGDFGRGRTNAASLSSRLVDELVAWLKTLASAAVYATLIVTFGFQVARVEGQSMSPTLGNQDRLIINKFVYLTHIGRPQLGDIVMLSYPNNPQQSFVKRVIAAENQTIRMVDGKVFVNDVPVDDSFVPPEYRGHDDYGPVVVPEGYYFVMGDHRTKSSDSRHWGFVPKNYIIGRVQLRWWPVPEARTF